MGSGGDDEAKELWRKVWHSGGPPKLSHFIWQACKGSLHIVSNPACEVCGADIESIRHVLVDCPSAKKAWDLSEYKDLWAAAPLTPFAEVFLWLSNNLGKLVLSQQEVP